MKDHDNPEVGELKVPKWIKVMWIAGILWVVFYIFTGLNHTPVSW